VDDRIPPFLTVEEASRLLKIGRTKAYLLTQEWRATGGRSGLPVVDLGDVLRVPGPAIERMLATGLGAPCPTTRKATGIQMKPTEAAPATPARSPAHAPTAPPTSSAPVEAATARRVVEPAVGGVAPTAGGVAGVTSTRTRRPRRRPINQLPLFQPLSSTDPNPDSLPPDDPEPTTCP
jgi:hypothetical protein